MSLCQRERIENSLSKWKFFFRRCHTMLNFIYWRISNSFCFKSRAQVTKISCILTVSQFTFYMVIHADCRLLFIFIVSVWCNSIHILALLVIFSFWFCARFYFSYFIFTFLFPWLVCFGSLSFRSFSNILFKLMNSWRARFVLFTFTSIGIHSSRIVCHTFQEGMQFVWCLCRQLLIILHTELKKNKTTWTSDIYLYERSIRYPLFTFHLFKTIKGYSCTADPFSSLYTQTKKKKTVKKRKINWKSNKLEKNEWEF